MKWKDKIENSIEKRTINPKEENATGTEIIRGERTDIEDNPQR